jgi:hypothetical protein
VATFRQIQHAIINNLHKAQSKKTKNKIGNDFYEVDRNAAMPVLKTTFFDTF